MLYIMAFFVTVAGIGDHGPREETNRATAYADFELVCRCTTAVATACAVEPLNKTNINACVDSNFDFPWIKECTVYRNRFAPGWAWVKNEWSPSSLRMDYCEEKVVKR